MSCRARAGPDSPCHEAADPLPGAPRVVVTGCYDWLHSGHVRFFMDAAELGAVYAVVGSDRNVGLLKGPGHPLQREDERRYMVGCRPERPQLPRLLGFRVDGRGTRDRADQAHPLCGQRGRRPAGEAGLLPGTRDRVRRAQADSPRRPSRAEQHGPARVLAAAWRSPWPVPMSDLARAHAGVGAGRSSVVIQADGHAFFAGVLTQAMREAPTDPSTRLIDVARRAGVSPMTVSRVVRGSPVVSAELRARVEEALAETGYLPNALASSLRAGRTGTIALLLPDMTNPFFTTLAQGVETAAREAGVTMLLANSDEDEDEEQRLVRLLVQRQVDGLLIVPAGAGAASIRLCLEQRRPRRARGPAAGKQRCRHRPRRLGGGFVGAGAAARRPRPSPDGRPVRPVLGADRGRPGCRIPQGAGRRGRTPRAAGRLRRVHDRCRPRNGDRGNGRVAAADRPVRGQQLHRDRGAART